MLSAGLRVLDLTSGGRAFCGQILAELGADVSRQSCPDVTDGDGRRALNEAVASRSVLIESFTPGLLEMCGLGWEALSCLYPDLIVVSITDFGLTGPRRKWISTDLVTAALGGQVYANGCPNKPPLRLYGDLTEFIASLFSVISVILAVRQRHQTGRGCHVDISVQECATASLDHVLGLYSSARSVWRRSGSLSLNGSIRLFRCRDGYALISVLDGFETLLEIMREDGCEQGLKGVEWNSPAYRTTNVARVVEAVAAWAATKSRYDLFDMGQALRLPWAAVAHPEEVASNEQLLARGFFINDGVAPFRTVPWVISKSSVSPTLPGGTGVKEEKPQVLPLSGVRVLDLTWVLAGPFATRLLGDFGAEVIKVQSRCVPGVEQDNLTPYFAQWNRGKRGVTLNLGHPDGQDLFRRLVFASDVVVESYSRRVMENWGLDYSALRTVKPGIIMVSMSAFGHTGPWADCVGFGSTVQALSGMTYLTSYNGDNPVGPGIAVADHLAGLYGAIAVLSALEHRKETGFGQYVDLSQFEAACISMRQPLTRYLNEGIVSRPVGNQDATGLAAPHNVYPCAGDDRWVAISVLSDAEWERLCSVIGLPDLADEARFASLEARIRNQTELDAIISKWTESRSAAEVESVLQAAGVRAGMVSDAADLMRDEQLLSRGFFATMGHPAMGPLTFDGTPIRMVGRPPGISSRPAPILGQHNPDVFCDLLGLSPEELRRFEAERVIF